MKKLFALGFVILFFVFVLTGCANYSYEETEINATVLECEEGTYHPDASYLATANMYRAQNNLGMWSTYTALANANGYYDYNVTINIAGTDYVVVRSKQYEIGEQIVILKVDTYQDAQLVKTEYK